MASEIVTTRGSEVIHHRYTAWIDSAAASAANFMAGIVYATAASKITSQRRGEIMQCRWKASEAAAVVDSTNNDVSKKVMKNDMERGPLPATKTCVTLQLSSGPHVAFLLGDDLGCNSIDI